MPPNGFSTRDCSIADHMRLEDLRWTPSSELIDSKLVNDGSDNGYSSVASRELKPSQGIVCEIQSRRRR